VRNPPICELDWLDVEYFEQLHLRVNVVVAVVSGKLLIDTCNADEVIAKSSKVTGRVSGRFHLGARHRTKVTLICKSWILD
jgi:hypothetical protein